MNVLDFNILAGWPGSTETWQYLQNMILNSQNAVLLGGRNFIVDGCLEAAGNVGNGLMVVNGEMLPFEGGPIQPNIIVVDQAVNRSFFGGASNPYYHNRKAVFGTGPGSVLYSDFKRSDPNNGVLARLDKVERMLKPLMGYDVAGTTVYGSWLFWGRDASEIPAGWEAVPDDEWKGKVPVVFDAAQVEFNLVGKIGGLKNVALSPAQQGSITFQSFGDDGDGDGSGTFWSMRNLTINGQNVESTAPNSASTQRNTRLNNDAAVHSNLQPYKVVLFIRFVG